MFTRIYIDALLVDEDLAAAETLIALSYLYYFNEISGVSDPEELAAKDWILYERAALTGSEEAIVSLASMYINGDPVLKFGPDLDIAKCLLSLTEHEMHLDCDGNIKRESVESCLAMPPDDRPRSFSPN